MRYSISSVIVLGFLALAATPATQPVALPHGEPGEIIAITYDRLKTYLESPKDKAVLLNFWGTFCPPCIKEIPDLMKLQTACQDRLQVVLVSVDDTSDIPAAQAKLKDLKVTVPSWQIGGDEQMKILGLHPEFTDLVFPSTFLYDKSGRQVARAIGKAHDFSGWEKFIKDALP